MQLQLAQNERTRLRQRNKRKLRKKHCRKKKLLPLAKNCWKKKAASWPAINHHQTHRSLFQYVLDKRCQELHNFVDHRYSTYLTLMNEIAKEVKTEKKANLTKRSVFSLTAFLDCDVCRSVYVELPSEHYQGGNRNSAFLSIRLIQTLRGK